MFALYFTLRLIKIKLDTVFIRHGIFHAQLRNRPPLMNKEFHSLRKFKFVKYRRNKGRLFIKVPIQDTGEFHIAMAFGSDRLITIDPELAKIYALSADFRRIGHINLSSNRGRDMSMFP